MHFKDSNEVSNLTLLIILEIHLKCIQHTQANIKAPPTTGTKDIIKSTINERTPQHI